MGSIRFAGVVFQVYSDDHLPRHVHGRYAGVDVIVEISGPYARRAKRKDAVTPRDAKRSDVAYVVEAAPFLLTDLNLLWEETHGASGRD